MHDEGGKEFELTTIRAVMDSFIQRFSSSRWPMTMQAHSRVTKRLMETTEAWSDVAVDPILIKEVVTAGPTTIFLLCSGHKIKPSRAGTPNQMRIRWQTQPSYVSSPPIRRTPLPQAQNPPRAVLCNYSPARFPTATMETRTIPLPSPRTPSSAADLKNLPGKLQIHANLHRYGDPANHHCSRQKNDRHQRTQRQRRDDSADEDGCGEAAVAAAGRRKVPAI